MSKTYKIASIPGDGIGVDVTDAAEQVLNTLAKAHGGFSFDFNTFDWSSKNYLERKWYMPEDGMDQLKKHDAIYFGAVGWPDVPDHISLWSLILPIRKHNNQYVNVRPTRILKGVTAPLAQLQKNPKDLDWVIIRENSEGEYAGQGGTTHENSPHTIGTEVAIFTRVGIDRIMRFAFETAKSRPAKKLTMVTKSNAQRHGMVLWDKVFHEVAKEYEGEVKWDKMLVDAMTVRMVNKPESMDTIVATNRKSHYQNIVRSDADMRLQSTQTFSLTSPPRSRDQSASRPRRTLTRHATTLLCSSRSTAQRPILPGRASQIRSALSGLQRRWCGGLVKAVWTAPLISLWKPLRTCARRVRERRTWVARRVRRRSPRPCVRR